MDVQLSLSSLPVCLRALPVCPRLSGRLQLPLQGYEPLPPAYHRLGTQCSS
jgi:hypothetical protein